MALVLKEALNEHEAAIDSFIPEAKKKADEIAKLQGKHLDSDSKKELWNRVFHKEMDRLTEAAGLRRHRPDKWR